MSRASVLAHLRHFAVEWRNWARLAREGAGEGI